MTYQRLVYAEADTAATMRRDARRAEVYILLRQAGSPATPSRPAHHDKVKQEIAVDDAAYRLATALHLHLH